jgi:hypothetical protein
LKYYTGVGSRDTPQHIMKFISKAAYWLAGQGYTGRSGSAAGADSAFERGFNHYDTVNGVSDYVSFEAYLPWKGFSDINEDTAHIVTPELPNYNEAVEIASTIHPAWNRLGRGAKALHTRNVYQVLGLDLKTPSKVLFCYAQPTKNKQGIVTGVKGGTNTAVQLAMKHNIPIYNFYLQEDIDKVKSLMENYKV